MFAFLKKIFKTLDDAAKRVETTCPECGHVMSGYHTTCAKCGTTLDASQE